MKKPLTSQCAAHYSYLALLRSAAAGQARRFVFTKENPYRLAIPATVDDAEALLLVTGRIAAQLVAGADVTIIALDFITHGAACVAHSAAHAVVSFFHADTSPAWAVAIAAAVAGALASGITLGVSTAILIALGERGCRRGSQGENRGDAHDVLGSEFHICLQI
ncbi:hypothetical protein CR105_03150 [Massilia eurypsychrophila]|uniref:Uncharacterized protein n=1 Tax=Massilia eurypsychrophila TaxID=1485217 RepID=A0A2G8TJ90_9BURK|nr:hypothetical protein CR105_03150 [Massilia eurypsychrophila]